jgi:hypothetical protein
MFQMKFILCGMGSIEKVLSKVSKDRCNDPPHPSGKIPGPMQVLYLSLSLHLCSSSVTDMDFNRSDLRNTSWKIKLYD